MRFIENEQEKALRIRFNHRENMHLYKLASI